MGTRADFYVGRGLEAKWVGSIAFDGYPTGIDAPVLSAKTLDEYAAAIKEHMATRDDWTEPARDGWPWPWIDSRTTDYAYAFDCGAVWASYFGGAWFAADTDEPDDPQGENAVFPERGGAEQGSIFGPRSGLLVITGGPA